MAQTPDIAVVGMACRFPGAADLAQFWDNLAAGVESITALNETDRRDAGIDRATWNDPHYVRAAPLLEDYDKFDAAFFGYAPHEASLLDPQHRIFLECVWTALEHAGYGAPGHRGAVGVYAGASLNTYVLSTGLAQRLRDDYVLTLIANDKDFLTSRVSYKLDLAGPSVSVQTACSTSLVAVHLACHSLLSGECDMAVAGGVSVKVPQRAGYRFDRDGPFSPDGHCRAFNSRARGTLFGSGAGVVVLKPLAEALAAGDPIHAVIKGSAVNNDGATKVDYTAPSVVGQAEVIAEAQAHAGIDADTISYVEVHGTATALGDPIEIAALTKAFRRTTERSGFCAIGSVKSNFGHLDAAAGVAGLIKTILALEHRMIPPSLHFDRPNPEIDFPCTPFRVNTTLSHWNGTGPRRAGVSSLGIGGTNAHVVVEEAPSRPESGTARPLQLLLLSAHTAPALETATKNLARHLKRQPAPDLADVGYTLAVGRKALRYRRMLVCRDKADAAASLEALPPQRARNADAGSKKRPVVFLFPGGGGGHPPAIADLYMAEPLFRARIDRGLEALRSLIDYDFASLLLGGADERQIAAFARPLIQLPATFLVEEALAALWMSWSVKPTALLGHSMGEVTAAHVAGVLDFSDALNVVMARARLAERAPPGGMLSIPLPGADAVPLLAGELDVASVNTPQSCVVSGTVAAIEALARRLAADNVETRRVSVNSAGHCRLFDPLLGEFEREIGKCTLRRPLIPFISNLTGTWITDAEATDPAYWARQYRHTVRFTDGALELLSHPDRLFLEAGPGHTLSTFMRAHCHEPAARIVVPSLRAETKANFASLLDALGRLWLAGADVDWHGFFAQERRQRVVLPTYPFERKRHWYTGGAAVPVRRGNSLRTMMRKGATLAQDVIERMRNGAAKPAEASTSEATAVSLTARVGPRTATERTIAEIWQNVLGIPNLSIFDDFFELGGNSLLLSRVMAWVNKTYQTDLPLLTLLEVADRRRTGRLCRGCTPSHSCKERMKEPTMDERRTYTPGKPCWFELAADDVGAAKSFYDAVLGWDFAEVEGAHRALVNKKVVSAIVEGGKKYPPGWTMFLATDDLRRTADAVVAAGGKMIEPPRKTSIGARAIAAEPTGGVFGLWQHGSFYGSELRDAPGAVCWAEMASRDSAKAAAFFNAVFDIVVKRPFPGFDYVQMRVEDMETAGILGLTIEGRPNQGVQAWLIYFQVDVTDDAVKAATARGGQVVNPADDTPFGRMAIIADPSGARFAVIERKGAQS